MKPPVLLSLTVAAFFAGCQTQPPKAAWTPLFPSEGEPSGWAVRAWDDVAKPAPADSKWLVKNGMLTSEGARGTWLVWEREIGDFDLEYDFKLGPRGNSGLALRAPMAGDPAFDGMELQMADFRYNTEATESELTGGLYRALAPRVQAYKPTEWNHYEVSLHGMHFVARLNGQLIQDVNLSKETRVVQRHDGRNVPPLKDRPRRGHLGFQELSRENGHVEIRNARIRIEN